MTPKRIPTSPTKKERTTSAQATTKTPRTDEARGRLAAVVESSHELLQLYSNIFENISDAVIITTPDRRVISWNKAAERISGYTAEEITAKKNPIDFLHTEYIGATPDSIRAALLTAGGWKGEATHQAKNGATIHSLLTISPIISKGGEYLGAMTIARDITDRVRTRRELITLNERLGLAQDTGHIGIFEYSFKTKQTWRNKEQERLFGIDNHPRRHGHKRLDEFVHPDDRERVAEAFGKALGGKEPTFDLEYRVVHPDRSVHWLESSGRIIYDEAGNPERYVGINLNIDEQKRIEALLSFKAEASKLLASSLDYRTTLGNIGTLAVPAISDWYSAYLLDADGQPQLVALSHKDPKKIAWGYRLTKKYPVDMSQNEGLPRVIKEGVTEFWPYIPPETFENHPRVTPELLKIIKKIGYTGAITVPLTSAGKIIGAISFVTAESKRRLAEFDRQMAEELAAQAGFAIERAQLHTAIEEERNRLANLVSEVPSIIWEAYGHPDAANQRIGFVNAYVETMLGYTVDEWLSTPNFWLAIVHPDDKERATEEAAAIFASGSHGVSRFRWIAKDGRSIPVEAHSFVIKDKRGNPTGMRGVTTDISERTEAERRKDEFISMASHELKTPITSIKLFTEILQRILRSGDTHTSPEEIGRLLGNIAEQIDKLAELVSDLLDVSKIQSGMLELRTSTFFLNELVAKTVQTIQPIAPKQKIVVAPSPAIRAHGDPDRINQILVNLLTNAIKYSPNSGRIDMVISTKGSEIVVEVRDYGIGIAPEHQKKIFERFYRVYDMTDKTFPGLGMGLYISHEIAKKHGGRMWVTSTPGKGSTFYFTIPVRPAEGNKPSKQDKNTNTKKKS